MSQFSFPSNIFIGLLFSVVAMEPEGGMTGLIGLEHLQQNSWQQQNWLEEDDDQDSDTDSKLSGSAAADSVM